MVVTGCVEGLLQEFRERSLRGGIFVHKACAFAFPTMCYLDLPM